MLLDAELRKKKHSLIFFKKVELKLLLIFLGQMTNLLKCYKKIFCFILLYTFPSSSLTIDPLILDLGTSWRRVVSFTPHLLYPRGKSPHYPLDRRLGGPQNRSGRYGEKSFLYWDSNFDLSAIQPVASRYTDCATLAPLHLHFFTITLHYIPWIQG
jgi:hypothetical protein